MTELPIIFKQDLTFSRICPTIPKVEDPDASLENAMISKYSNALPAEMMPGLVRRTLISGRSMMVCEFTLEKSIVVDTFSPPREDYR